MSISDQQKTVQYLLTQMTYMLLAKSPVRDAIQKAAQLHEGKLRAMLTDDEFKPIGVMRDTLVELVRKLVTCPDVATLELCHAYIEALNNGEVLIAVDQEPPPGYQRNQ